jgi:hypothetical protein
MGGPEKIGNSGDDDSDEEIDEENQSKLGGYLTVIGGISLHLFLGNLYLWGNIEGYIVSYY